MKEYTVKELELQLAVIDHNIAFLQQEKKVTSLLHRLNTPKKPFIKRDAPLTHFHVITEPTGEKSGYIYQLTAYTNNPKKWATELHKETGCVVRVGMYTPPAPKDGK